MHVVLLILKIIGTILVSILGLLLFLVILLLFVPVRYQLHLVVRGGVNVNACISWLLHIVHLSILYEQKEYKFCIRIFGIPIKQNRDEKKESASKERKNRKVTHKKKTNDRKSKQGSETVRMDSNKPVAGKDKPVVKAEKEPVVSNGEKSAAVEVKGQKAKKTETEQCDTIEEKKQITEKPKEMDKKPKKNRTFHPIWALKKLWQSVRMKLHNIPELWKRFTSKIKELADKKNKLFTLLKKEGTKSTFRKIWKTLHGLIRYISPRTIKGYIRFGTEDPCQTGQLLGGISILQAYLNSEVRFYPDFEKKVFEADLKAHGRVRIIRFLSDGGKVYFDKEIKKFIADVKQLKEELDG